MKQKIITTIVFAFLLLPSITLAINHTNSFWVKMDSGTTNNLRDIWVSASGTAFAVGDYGTIMRFDGTSWTRTSIGSNINLNGVWGRADNDVFAVGTQGAQYHYNGSTWSRCTANPSPGSTTLTKVYGNDSNAYCSMYNGKVQRYTSAGFWFNFTDTAITTGGLTTGGTYSCIPTALNSIYVSPDNKIYACGFADISRSSKTTAANLGSKPVIIWHDGTRWNFKAFLQQPTIVNGFSFTDPIYFYFTGNSYKIQGLMNIWGNGNNVYVMGHTTNTPVNLLKGCIMNFQTGNITNFRQRPEVYYIDDAWGTSGNNLFTVSEGGKIAYYDGSQFFSSVTEAQNDIHSIFGRSETNIFAVGNNGTILHYDGTGKPGLSSPAQNASLNSTNISFTWQPYPESQEFWLQVANDPGFENLVFDSSVGNVNNTTLSTLTNTGVRYYWRVKARNSIAWSTFSETWSFINGQSIPSLSSPTNGAVIKATNIAFSWNQVANATQYFLQISRDAAFTNFVYNDYANTNQATIPNFTNDGSQYYWHVAPVFSSGISPNWSATSYFINK